MTLYTLPFYLFSLVFAVYGVDQYTDIEGRKQCGTMTPDDSQAVYQLGIGITVVYHTIEFMRQLAIASTALVGVNLVGVYYVLSLNVIFGVVALVIGIASRLGPKGAECAAAQPNRALYLILQFIPLFLMIIQSFHILLAFRLKGEEWCNTTINEASDDEEEEEEEGEGEEEAEEKKDD